MFGIIDGNADNQIVRDAQRILFQARVHSAVFPEAPTPLPYPYPLRGLIILRPEALADVEGTVAALRASFPLLPIALFYRETNKTGNRYAYTRIADFVYEDDVRVERVIADLFDAYEARGGAREKKIAGGLCISREKEYATIFGLPTPYSQGNLMLLYYLLKIAPRAATKEELKSICGIRTSTAHAMISRISEINCQTNKSFPALRLIERTKENAYRIHS